MTGVRKLLGRPWIWSFIAAFGVWLATILFTGGASTLGITQAALTFAAFSIIVGLGQMFVITLGPGNVDLSIPSTMTLAGTVALARVIVQMALPFDRTVLQTVGPSSKLAGAGFGLRFQI